MIKFSYKLTLIYIFNILLVFSSTFFFYQLSFLQNHNGVSYIIFNNGSDGLLYWDEVQEVLNGTIIQSKFFYVNMISSLFNQFHINDPFYIRLINYLAYLVFIFIIIKIMNLVVSHKKNMSKFIVLLLLTFYFSLIIILTSSIIRDIWILLLYFSSIYLILLMINKKVSLFKILILGMLLYALYLFRPYASFSIILSTFLFYIITKSGWKILILFFIVFVLWFQLYMNFKVPIVNMSLYNVINYRNNFVQNIPGGSQMGIVFPTTNIFLFLSSYMYSYINNLVGPLFWNIKSLSTLVIFLIESFPVTIMLVIIILRMKTLNMLSRYLLMNVFIWNALISLSNDNIGAAVRLRSLGYVGIFIVIASIFSNFYRTNNERKNTDELALEKL